MWYKDKPIIALAPMADYTDSPYSLVCREVSGKNFVIFREMVSAEAIVRGNEKTINMCRFKNAERPIVIQIFGAKPDVMAKAARFIVDNFQPDGIDINMGCPVPKVAQRTLAGAAMMKNPDLAADIVRAIKSENFGVPLSVKTRLGWTFDDDIFSFSKRLEKAGADLLIIHGRTKAQGYGGVANWQRISEVKEAVNIPVIANGDIRSEVEVDACLKVTGADGVMIGRAALGNPWIFRTILGDSRKVTIAEFAEVILTHARYHIKRYGERGIVTFRKHLSWYFHGNRLIEAKDIKKIRSELVRIVSLSDLKNILDHLS